MRPALMLCILALASCARQSPRGAVHSDQTREKRLNTEAQLRALHSVMLLFHRDSNSWPTSLSAACDLSPMECLLLDRGERPTDFWGSPVTYAPVADGFELRSLGPDRKAKTSDDLVISYPLERIVVRKAAGCYQPVAGWWASSPTVVRLDSFPPRVDYYGSYALQIDLPIRFVAFTNWFPIDRDSIALEWASGSHVFGIRLESLGDTLRGHADLEYATLDGPKIWRGVLRLVKTDCEG